MLNSKFYTFCKELDARLAEHMEMKNMIFHKCNFRISHNIHIIRDQFDFESDFAEWNDYFDEIELREQMHFEELTFCWK